MSNQLLSKPGGYRARTNALLTKHELHIPRSANNAVEALAKRIMFEREGIARKVREKQIKRDRLNERIDKAITHSKALLAHKGDGEIHLDKLCDALCSESLLMELALCHPRFDLDKTDLNGLLQSLLELRDKPRPRPGRPKDRRTLVIASGANVWTSAGRAIDFSCHDSVLKGDFYEFLMDVYSACGLSKPEGDEITALNEKLRSLFV